MLTSSIGQGYSATNKYQSQKAQNKAQNPAFGMALGKGMEDLIEKNSIKILISKAEERDTLLRTIKSLNDHKLFIDYSPTENKGIIYSGADISMSKHIVNTSPKSSYADVINLIKNDLDEYDYLERRVQDKERVTKGLDEALAVSENLKAEFLNGIKSGAFIEDSKLQSKMVSAGSDNGSLICSLENLKSAIFRYEQKLHDFFN